MKKKTSSSTTAYISISDLKILNCWNSVVRSSWIDKIAILPLVYKKWFRWKIKVGKVNAVIMMKHPTFRLKLIDALAYKQGGQRACDYRAKAKHKTCYFRALKKLNITIVKSMSWQIEQKIFEQKIFEPIISLLHCLYI